MNFEGAKENIQPLAAGRNVERLEVALNAESHSESQQLLSEQRKQFEHDIASYVGDDPLDIWFEYILWTEQSYPKSGKESALEELLKKCLSTFEKDVRYAQDPRLIRLFTKYIDTKKNPDKYYTKLYNAGVGTMIADLYIAWAHYYDILDNFEQAEQVYQKGLDARAAPFEHLKQAHERFQFSVSQRILRKDAYRQEFLTTMEERRSAFTSLRSLKSSKVGSIRTGRAVKSNVPGQVKQNQENQPSAANVPLQVYDGSSTLDVRTQPQLPTSVVKDIEDSMMENNVEPGPWSKSSSRKSVYNSKYENSELRLAILEDIDIEQPSIKFTPLPKDDGDNAIRIPRNFPRKNEPQGPFEVPLFVEDSIPPDVVPAYDSISIHPNKTDCNCPEEVHIYRRWKKGNISNPLTQRLDKIFLNGPSIPIRLPPTFAKQNKPQSDMETERPNILSIPEENNYVCNLSALYPEESKEEFSFEEIKREKWAIAHEGDEAMDETVCVKGRQSFGVTYSPRSSFTTGRKSIMPIPNDRGSIYIPKSTTMVSASIAESNSDMELDEDNELERKHNRHQLVGKSSKDNMNMGSVKMNDKHKEKATPTTSIEQRELKQTHPSWPIFNDEDSKSKSSVEQGELKNTQSTTPRGQWSMMGNDGESKSNSPAEQNGMKTQWSIFNGNESKTTSPIISTKSDVAEGDRKNDENSPLCSGWSVFNDDQSNVIASIAESNSDMELDEDNELERKHNRHQLVGKSSKDNMNMGSVEMNDKHKEKATPTTSIAQRELKQTHPSWPIFNDEDSKSKSSVEQGELKNTQSTTPRGQWSMMGNDGESKSNSPAEQNGMKTQWSIFNDNESKTTSPIISTKSDVAEGDRKNDENSPLCSGWSVFNDDQSNVISPVIFTTKNTCSTADVDKALFAVPQSRPLNEPSAAGDKRTLDTATSGNDVKSDGPELKKTLLDRSPYPIGPHTGAIRKIIRQNPIVENATPMSAANSRGRIPSSNEENRFKFPEPIDTVRIHENTDLDFSLCTEEFNYNLGDQMISTPVAIRQREVGTEQINIQEIIQPLKLSTIMETTEGSAHTASTKSLIQFSSPEDDDPSKPMNRTKFVGANTGSDSDFSGSSINDCKSDGESNVKSIIKEENQQSEKNQPTSSAMQHSVEHSLPTIQFSLLLEDKNLTQKNLECPSKTNKNEVATAAKEIPSKNYPFPIFEDTEATVVNPANKYIPKVRESLLNFFTASPEPRTKSTEAVPNSLQSSENLIGNTHPERDSSQPSMLSLQVSQTPRTLLQDSLPSQPLCQIELPSEPLAKTILPLDQPLQTSLPSEPSIQTILSSEPALHNSIPSDSSLSKSSDQSSRKPSPQDGQSKNVRFELSSICIKEEPQSFLSRSGSEDATESFGPKIADVQSLAPTESEFNHTQIVDPGNKAKTILHGIGTDTRVSISITEDEMDEHVRRKLALQNFPTTSETTFVSKNSENNSDQSSDEEVFEVADQSIYFKHNSIYAEPSWREDEHDIAEEDNFYEHEIVNLEETRATIDMKLSVGDIDPFDEMLKNGLLQELTFIQSLQPDETTCQLVKKIPQVSAKGTIRFKDTSFDVIACIGRGAYGRVYSVKSSDSGRMYAVKKEVPANVWECYILSEVRKRIQSEKLLAGFMRMNYVVLGNNASLLFSEYSSYGSLLDVCNRVFTSMRNHVEESIVFILAIQMLDIIDHLHAANILHLDLKPDNFLVMKPLSCVNHRDIFIQLIDFGNAVDLMQFPSGQKFNAIVDTKNFVCIEMVEKRSWIFEPDLYCLAGTIHSVLFGSYMEVHKKGLNYEIRKAIPRYYNRPVWEIFFSKLINIKDHSQPDLQEIKENFLGAIDEDKKLIKKIEEFNRFIVESPIF